MRKTKQQEINHQKSNQKNLVDQKKSKNQKELVERKKLSSAEDLRRELKRAKETRLVGRKSKKMSESVKFSKKLLVEDILREARVMRLRMGWAEMIAEKVAEAVEKWAKTRAIITEDDLSRVVEMELAKYHKDLAYVYKNRDKII